MKEREYLGEEPGPLRAMGLGAWLLARLRGQARPRRRLRVLERVALGPRQSLVLVEAEGRRFLVASGADGAPVLRPLHGIEDLDESLDCAVPLPSLRAVTRPTRKASPRVS